MKKLDSVQQTLIDMGFVIDEKNENYVLGEVAIPAVEIIGHTIGSFLEKGKRRGWLHEEPMGVGKPMLLQPGMICENNVVDNNFWFGNQIDTVRHIIYRNWPLGMWIDPDAEDEATKSKLKPVVGTHTMGIRTVETEDSKPHGCVPGVGTQCGCLERAKRNDPGLNFQGRDGELKLVKVQLEPTPPMKVERSKDGKIWEDVATWGDAVADESGFFYSVD